MFIKCFIAGMLLGGAGGIFTMCLLIVSCPDSTALDGTGREKGSGMQGSGRDQRIRFVDIHNHVLFEVMDGELIQLITRKGDRHFCICHYLDETHVKVDGKEWELLEFARQMAEQEAAYLPLTMGPPKKKKGGAVPCVKRIEMRV